VLIAHLFGTSSPLDAQIAAARRHGLLFVEDCAQAFRGRSDTGHPEADVSMFSFGTIKTATALGGGLLRVRDPQVLARMREIQAGYPVQPRGAYLQRLVKYVGLKSLTYRPTFQALVGVLRLMGRDHDRMLNASIRGFPADRLFELIRQQPCAPLLQLLARRIRTFDEARQVRRTERGRQLAADLNGAFPCPAAELRPHVFWVFPLLAERPDDVLAHLRRHGFDGTQGQSMVAIKPPPGREECDPVAAREIVARLLFLPFYGAMPDAELRRMAGVLREYAPSVAPAKTHTALQPVA
jgi:dTDP-4-amino-4,6-dideoxygalactose transaminase